MVGDPALSETPAATRRGMAQAFCAASCQLLHACGPLQQLLNTSRPADRYRYCSGRMRVICSQGREAHRSQEISLDHPIVSQCYEVQTKDESALLSHSSVTLCISLGLVPLLTQAGLRADSARRCLQSSHTIQRGCPAGATKRFKPRAQKCVAFGKPHAQGLVVLPPKATPSEIT